MVQLYLLLVRESASGYFFAENGSQSWKTISETIGRVGKDCSVFASEKVRDISLQDAADEYFDGNLKDTESVLASK